MTKYLLADRERNGYDDSDFYAVFWDTDSQTIGSETYGSTRYPSPRTAPASEYISPMPDEEHAKCREFYKERMFEALRDHDKHIVDEPDDASIGDSLATLKAGIFKDKRTTKVSYFEGEIGTVIWIGAFGTFYCNGYKHPGRFNRRVGLRFSDGRVVFIGLKDCKLARAYKTEDELLRTAEVYAQEESYHTLFNFHGYMKF